MIPLKSKPPQGFTLLELILVILIISIALAIVGPTIGSRLNRGDPKRTAQQLRAAMGFMRVQAVQQGQEMVLVVDPRTNTYWREDPAATTHEQPVDAIEVSPEGGILSANSPWIRENDQVEFRFYPDGTNSGGEVQIEKRRGVEVTTYVLGLNPLLGTATLRQDG